MTIFKISLPVLVLISMMAGLADAKNDLSGITKCSDEKLFSIILNDDLAGLKEYAAILPSMNEKITFDVVSIPILHAAIRWEAEKCVKFMLENGASPYLPDDLGEIAIQAAAETKNNTIISLIKNAATDKTSYLNAGVTNLILRQFSPGIKGLFISQDKDLQIIFTNKMDNFSLPSDGSSGVIKNHLFLIAETNHIPQRICYADADDNGSVSYLWAEIGELHGYNVFTNLSFGQSCFFAPKIKNAGNAEND